MRFLNLWLQIALEWLHDCCHLVLPLVVMAASRLLGAAAACVILLSFAAGHCKSYWSGCIKAAIMICQQIFSILVLVIFRSNSFSKVLQNRVFFLWRRDLALDVQFLTSLRVVLLCFAIHISISHCSCCVKVACCRDCMRNTIVPCSWALKIVMEWLHQGCDSDLSAFFFKFGVWIFL